MNKKYLLIASFPLMLSACQTFPTHLKDNEAMIIKTQSPNLLQTISDYTWSKPSPDNIPPVTLSLDADKHLLLTSGCNNLMGTWQFDGQKINTSPLATTQMMCPPQLMAQEQAIRQFFNQAELKLNLQVENPIHPRLILENQVGQKLEFKGNLKPEAQYKSTGEVIFLEISPKKIPCTTGNSEECLQVKQVKYNEQGIKTQIDQSWQVLPVNIQGYQHDSGLRKIIRVKRFNTQPKTSRPEYAYIYDMTVEQEVVPHK